MRDAQVENGKLWVAARLRQTAEAWGIRLRRFTWTATEGHPAFLQLNVRSPLATHVARIEVDALREVTTSPQTQQYLERVLSWLVNEIACPDAGPAWEKCRQGESNP